ncbi:AAA family ATPase, partial [Longimicrobium sp.]|uniref:AAA family ATPase n=1 Tax=Longimicrobium sp. TaxID=2029185 RepID=UPI002F951F9F
MARWHRSPEALEAARDWRDRCLLADGSILSGNRLWTLENLLHLDRHFVQNLDEGEGDFLQKLEAQLAPAPAQAKQLAAEILWILYLSVSERGMKGATKRIQIRRAWEWSGERLPDAPKLGEPLERGVGFPGTAFNTGRWRELVFCIELFRDWKRLRRSDAESLISDPWRFAEWVDRHPASKNRQFRHMLLYLLFPESFERVMTSSHKEQILRRLGAKLGLDVAVDGMDRMAVDRALVSLRRRLEERFDGAEADYYEGPIRSEWMGKGSVPKVGARKATPPRAADKAHDLSRQLQSPGDRRVWLIAPGEGARLWQEFQRDGVCAIGWDELGDLAAYPTYEAAYEALREVRGGNPLNDANACFEFAHRMRLGDLVIAKQGRSVIVGVGEVTSGYRYDDARSEYRNVRDVRWDQVGRWTLPEEHRMVVKTLTEMTTYPAWLSAASEALGPLPSPSTPPGGSDIPLPGPDTVLGPYPIEDALDEMFLTQAQFSGILDALGRRKNVILEGAPGVGKTFVARRIAWALMGQKDDSRVQMVQFHQSYAYEDFVQGWRPQAQGFALQNGVFHQFCKRAQADP